MVYLPSSPNDRREDVGMAKAIFFKQTEYWIWCYRGKDKKPVPAASCWKGSGICRGRGSLRNIREIFSATGDAPVGWMRRGDLRMSGCIWLIAS